MNDAKVQRTLVIGDVHERFEAARLLINRFAGPGTGTRIVMLGDYFDAWGGHPEGLRQTCRWLGEMAQRPDTTLILGNHDLPYFVRHPQVADCPGWTRSRQKVFDEECADLSLDRFVLAARAGPWLLSHAGFARRLVLLRSPAALVAATHATLARLQTGARDFRDPLLGIGPGRGGGDSVGGVTWLDWSREFLPVGGLHQIVGHTPALGMVRGHHMRADRSVVQTMIFDNGMVDGPVPQPGPAWESINWCLDVGELGMAGLISDEGFQVVRVS